MLREAAGIDRVRMLYLQLLYRCNFAYKHCFHGELLKSNERYTREQAEALLRHFHDNYQLEAVTLLGGEPLLYPDIVEVAAFAKRLGLTVEICTNAHRGFRDTITAVAPHLDKFRVSLDGLEANHDAIRRAGSFAAAIEMIRHAAGLGLTTGATMTVTEHNLADVAPLARTLQGLGVTELKLHALRLVGNAADNPGLAVADLDRYTDLHRQIRDADLDIAVIYDSDLSPIQQGETCSNLVAGGWLDRIESDPRGGLTVSCKAVGRDVHAFRWDKTQQAVVYEPHEKDELAVGIPDVIYVPA